MDIPIEDAAALVEGFVTIGVVTGYPVTRGMDVVGADGERVGRLKDVDASSVLVDRPLKRDIYVPHAAIQGVRDNRIVLTIPADEVDRMGWPHPDLLP